MTIPHGAILPEHTLFCADAALFAAGADHVSLIESLLREHHYVRIPALPHPILLSRPIVLESGSHLCIDEATHLRMMEGCGGCMARNASVQTGMKGPIAEEGRDADILIEGGQWEFSPRTNSIHDDNPAIQAFSERNVLLGVIFFSHAERVTVRNITVRQSAQYGVLIADCRDFVVEHIFFDKHDKDGVHVNGPASDGLIQHMRGHCGDDFVALNAWDWDTSAVSFGPISRITVQHIACEHDEMRLLPGRKTFPDGSKLDCPVTDCSFSDISGAYNFKMYQQPNCHNYKRAHKDFSEIAGLIKNVTFSDIRLPTLIDEGLAEVHLDAMFEMGADCDKITFENFSLGFTMEQFREKNMSIAIIGPKSSTWTQGNPDPSQWTELFEPDLIVTAENIAFRNIRFADGVCTDQSLLIREQHLTPNPDYPRTIPKGGTGYGIIESVRIG